MQKQKKNEKYLLKYCDKHRSFLVNKNQIVINVYSNQTQQNPNKTHDKIQ